MYHDTIFSALICKSDEELAAEEEKTGGRAKRAENRSTDPIANRNEGMALVERIKNLPFVVTSVARKDGKKYVLRLFDLTSLQVECNKKFACSADETLKLAQSLYEKEMTIYPCVDTTFLGDDIYPKCPNILKGLKGYEVLTAPLSGTSLPKSKGAFDSSKITGHHTIIPTRVHPQNPTNMERKVFDLIARRFIVVSYPDCKVSTTTVVGEVDGIESKVTGEQILEPGWRVVFSKDVGSPNEGKEGEGGDVLPVFVKGESGPHLPDLNEKWIQPPKSYTEATLLRATETAGKLVGNDRLRDALKESGIGRSFTRAAIIETLFKRNYIHEEKKSLIATPAGMGLVQLTHKKLLKSAELAGIWEKKLRETEKEAYNTRQFLEELKLMVAEIVNSALSDNTNHRITIQEVATVGEERRKKEPKRWERRPTTPRGKKMKVISATENASPTTGLAQPDMLTGADSLVGQLCSLYGKGTIIRGKAAYGCSGWRNGYIYRKTFEQFCCFVGT